MFIFTSQMYWGLPSSSRKHPFWQTIDNKNNSGVDWGTKAKSLQWNEEILFPAIVQFWWNLLITSCTDIANRWIFYAVYCSMAEDYLDTKYSKIYTNWCCGHNDDLRSFKTRPYYLTWFTSCALAYLLFCNNVQFWDGR